MQGVPVLNTAEIKNTRFSQPDTLPRSESITHENILKLTHALQTTLDISAQLGLFSLELQPIVSHLGICFVSAENGQNHSIGREGNKHYTLELKIPGESKALGSLRLSRDTSFSLMEIENIHRLSANLAYPVRNAIMYETAVASAAKDPLTGVNNRTLMDSTINREIDLARRHDQPLTLLCADVDFFKRINDSFGHAAGDEVLRSVANAIRRCVRSSDVIFRFGGEEFVVLLPNTDAKGGHLLAERIRISIANTVSRYLDYHINVTISIGAHCLLPEDSASSLFNKADKALYEAKNKGRNQVRLAS
jgi:diguanylate cyclase (GGDEF)-like protein